MTHYRLPTFDKKNEMTEQPQQQIKRMHYFNSLKNIPALLLIVLLAIVTISDTGCKTRRLAKEKAKQEALKIEKAKEDLNALLNDNTTSLEDREKKLAEIKSLNIDNDEVQKLLDEVENKLKKERDEVNKKLEKEKKKQQEEVIEVQKDLNDYFIDIAGASNATDANNKINKALSLFTSKDANVLIIISEMNGEKDYDKPTTINNYLNKIKDTKRYESIVDTVKKDDNGKIRTIVFRKK